MFFPCIGSAIVTVKESGPIPGYGLEAEGKYLVKVAWVLTSKIDGPIALVNLAYDVGPCLALE